MRNYTLLPFLLLSLVLWNAPQQAAAQYANAADYPFVAGEEPFQYLTGGTVVSTLHTDDAAVQNIPIGFSFPFCGTTYTTGSVSSNLWFSLSASTGTGNGVNNNNLNFAQFASNNTLPVFMPFWDDMGWFIGATPPGAASYITTGTAPNRIFTFEWKNWGWDFSPIDGSYSAQLQLHENGSFKFLYKREDGPVASAQSVNSSPGWFGASIGFAKNLTDFQFLNNSTRFATSSNAANFQKFIDARPFSNQTFMWLAPCTNATSVEVVAPTDVCVGQTFRLGAVAQPLSIGTHCQWYYSDNGTNWIAMPATTGIVTDLITAPRWYQVKITCGSQVITSAPKLVEVSPHYKCYCESGSTVLTNQTASAMDIGSLYLINYTTNDTLLKNAEPTQNLAANIYSVKGYSDFTQEFSASTPTLYRDTLYRLSTNMINWGTSSAPPPGAIAAYIDYNHNAVFDEEERLLFGVAQNILPTPYRVSDTFRVADDAEIGLTRMRVVMAAGTAIPDSCGAYADGETEDYLVMIAPPPCNGPMGAGTLEGGDTTMCAGYMYLLTDTTYEKSYGGLERRWQVSADGIYWSDVAGSTNKDTLNRLFAYQPLHYRVRMECTYTGDSTFSNQFFINTKPSYKCYCYSEATGGKLHDTSDVGSFKIHNFEVNDGGTHLLNPRAYRTRTDRTDLAPLEMIVDSMYSFHVFHTMPRNHHADAKITVFMDFNNNHVYDVPYERVYTGFTSIGYHTLLNNIIIPNNVIVEMPTGMRVILNNDVSPNIPSDEACGPYASGETEDYIIIFKRPFPQDVKDLNTVNNFSIFPNPSNGSFFVQFSNHAAAAVDIAVMDITGRVVQKQTAQHTGGIFRHAINIDAPKGVYMVEVNVGGQRHVSKLVVE